MIFECPFNIIDSSLAIKKKDYSFFSELKKNNVFILTNRSFLTYFKQTSFSLTEFDEPEDISLIEIEDMIQAGIDLEQNLKHQLSTFEDVENEIDYLVFFEQVSHYFDPSKGILTFQNIIQKGIFPAVEQYMNLISDKNYLSKVNEQFDTYFSQFNLIIKTMSNYLMLIHNSEVSLFKSKLYECNSNYIPDLKFRSLLVNAYRNTPDISSVLISIEDDSDLEFVKTEKNNIDFGQIDWQLFHQKINDY